MSIILNQVAPDFALFDQQNQQHQLKDYRGKWLLLYFYPKDNTPGCTVEACTLRDRWGEFVKLNAVVLGISADSVSSHQKFSEKHSLPFPILADEKKTMLKAYGVLAEKSMFGKTFLGIKRSSFLIDPEGKIAKIYQSVKPAVHAEQVLADIRKLS
ncbi:MAG: Peroxiredoxin [Candidatus Pacebacteria bacterium GW2011_GWF2_38_9]|nr:MAG: peroxiredoxin, peroxiredoxin Q/BCP [candidate division TM6 bacterium GW2011_GWF2_28_16]KKQ08707.1 MAG: Peroxiredoxin [Candidatus Pacebacteria bacterium GW2011_GWF1_36_5]KKQ88962.1 MAG: Peroxiredoxin [Candidatus Pacebacteria bacterium GW2011_GWF2_38_9]HAZ73137.1 thioredoxin-dependent thiol peroxidase [Candidatus Paceibacterota bacterium]